MTPEQLKEYYQMLFEEHGDAPASVQHVSRSAQNIRFKIFQKYIKPQSSIVDLGCGLADFLVFLRQQGLTGEYLGCDFVPEFIFNNQTKFKQDMMCNFQRLDLINDEYPQGYDYLVMSGIFNNQLNCNEQFLYQTVEKAFQVANKGVIFNALSSYVEYQDSSLFYIDPLLVFSHIKTHISPYVLLKHDYITKENGFPYEFTMVVNKAGELP